MYFCMSFPVYSLFVYFLQIKLYNTKMLYATFLKIKWYFVWNRKKTLERILSEIQHKNIDAHSFTLSPPVPGPVHFWSVCNERNNVTSSISKANAIYEESLWAIYTISTLTVSDRDDHSISVNCINFLYDLLPFAFSLLGRDKKQLCLFVDHDSQDDSYDLCSNTTQCKNTYT